MTRYAFALALAACVILWPRASDGQGRPPGTRVDLDRRVFIDVNQAAPTKVFAQLADALACALDVDRRLPHQDITLRLSNVRVRTALDAVCDMVGCRWRLDGGTLRVEATAPPPPVPLGAEVVEKLNAPLTGVRWKLDRVPLREVLARLSQDLGVQLVLEGADPSTPITADLTGDALSDALTTIERAVGFNPASISVFTESRAGEKPVFHLKRREEPAPRQEPAGAPTDLYAYGARGLTMPVLIREVRPQYTRETLQAGIQGTVVLSCVVGADGTVGDFKVLESLHPVLDSQAIAAARQWRFTPGTKDGKPVPVRIEVELTFTTR